MGLVQGRLVFALMMLLVLSVACKGGPTVIPNPPTRDIYELFLEEINSNWKDVDPQRVESDEETPYEEWVVFYREDDSSEKPFDAAIYRLITDRYPAVSDKTPSFVAYDLWPPCDAFVCQCDCKAERADLLSAYTDPELIIWDKCRNGQSGLRAYRWVTETMKYELLAYFDGDSISMEEDQVVIDNDTPGGADLVSRCTYSPLGGVRPFTVEEKMSSSECEIAFPGDVPDDVLTSPYPEMIVMALYSQIQYTDTTKIQPCFAEGVWDTLGGCDAGQCGCPVTSNPISHVRVISMSVAEARQVVKVVHHTCSPDQAAAAPDLAVVTVDAVCEYGEGPDWERAGNSQPISVMWQLVWEGDGWRFMGSPIPVEE